MSNLTLTGISTFPPEPTFHWYPQPSLLPGISDQTLAIILPILVYILGSVFFYVLTELDLFGQYRIHPFDDDLHRNRVSRLGCLQGVIRYHVIQLGIGLLLSYNSEPELVVADDYYIYQWARRIRKAIAFSPSLITLLGLDLRGITSMFRKTPVLFRLEALLDVTGVVTSPTFSAFELNLARIMVSFVVPAVQFLVFLAVIDTWIYFWHRACHANKTLYRIIHAQHHQLYVPYAYGAVYAHWTESFILDIMSFVLANAIAGLSVRQIMLTSSLATLKTIMDHCGYVFPKDPLTYINANDAQFHDLHHQTWGLKYNFSTYTVFWDKLLGTAWTDVQGANDRYARTRELIKSRTKLVADGVTISHSKSE